MNQNTSVQDTSDKKDKKDKKGANPPILQLDHVAIAVENLDIVQKIYTDLGLTFPQGKEEVPREKVRVLMAPIAGPSHIEFVESTHPEGNIAKFIQKKGPGIHHLCFRVPDIQGLQETLKKLGYVFLYEKPQEGAQECFVNFLHPKSTHGVLIEFSQFSQRKI